MVEMVMIFSLGFLAASLLMLGALPFVHSRAERLTIGRVEASIPFSIAEVHASKDILRAEFAMSTRRQEQAIEHLRSKMMAYARELRRKTPDNGRPQPEVIAGASREGGGRPSAAIGSLEKARAVLVQKEAEIAKLKRELDERSRASDAQRVELVALKIQIDALNRQLAEAGKRRVQEQIGVAKRRAGLRLAG